ncbi:MAG: Ca2+-binding EF-hand superfamily protein [Glaciecola sp.]|jgi:Ca2+-binding EF-hand superfamily protein|uniref:EF-hand domain-containing protein n=1 Tax=Congregibacter sp. TaxID=2744308 RepID=UPI0039E5A3F9
MKKIRFVLSSVTALLASMTSMAQPQGGILSLDSDGDGQISREEFQPAKHRGGPKMFKRADADGDGELTRDEMLAAVETAGERQAKMPQMFDAMDTDGNGVVSQTEAQDQAFQRMDANGDGFVSEDEAKAMHEKRGQRRKSDTRQDSDQS